MRWARSPQAAQVTVINRFLVLFGLASNAYRVQWSGLNNVNASTSWDNITAQSNFQDMADGGLVRSGSGGDQFGLVFQDSVVRSMTFNPGSPEVFDFYKISDSDGIFANQSAVSAGGKTFFISTQGFKVIPPGGYPQPIGKEKFDRTFFADVDTSNLQLCIAAADPKSPRVYWAYKSKSGQANLFDKMIVYDYALDRATTVQMFGEFITTLAKPGLTLENMDAVASGIISVTGAANNGGGLIRLTLSSTDPSWTYGLPDTSHIAGDPGNTNLSDGSQNHLVVQGVVGTTEANGTWAYTYIDSTHIDLVGSAFVHSYVSGGKIGGALDSLTFSLDDVAISAQAALAGANSTHAIGFYTGPNLAATLQTAEQGGMMRMRVRSLRPATDAPTALASVSMRETQQVPPTVSTGQPIGIDGLCQMDISTRYMRSQLFIPAGAVWTFAIGVEPDTIPEGSQ